MRGQPGTLPNCRHHTTRDARCNCWPTTNSPFVRIARTALIEKGIGLDLTIVDPWADDARLRAANAATRVPTLVLDDGTPLTEAMLIVQWLEAITAVTLYDYQQLRYADQPWLPRTPRLQALAEAWRWRESFRKTMPFVA
ncbi:MAG: glutathione S-transferase N-terminal domain-containing protein [Burkholderiales bacterium]|nr:glutathione S-transferase N-terminal domain-containing protein [Burkholderiales bacterium]